jgi:hypothetical protein
MQHWQGVLQEFQTLVQVRLVTVVVPRCCMLMCGLRFHVWRSWWWVRMGKGAVRSGAGG